MDARRANYRRNNFRIADTATLVDTGRRIESASLPFCLPNAALWDQLI
jgi:hypothetical protein